MNQQERWALEEDQAATEEAAEVSKKQQERIEQEIVATAAIARTDGFRAIKRHIVEELRPALVELTLSSTEHMAVIRAQGAHEILGNLLAHFEDAVKEKQQIDEEGMG